MPVLLRRLSSAKRNPFSLALILLNKLSFWWSVYILRDEFSRTASKWFSDRGDLKLRLSYPLTKDSIVVDLGAYKGDFAYDINRKYDCYVYCFEPVSKFYLNCKKRFDSNKKIKCFDYGLSNANGSCLISNEANASSLIKNNKSSDCEIVNIKQFEQAMEDLQIKHIDLLKINIEGSEFLLLPHIINSSLIKNISNIQVQFHAFYPNAKGLRNQIQEQLSKTHKISWNYPFIWESWEKNC